jgi:hypothetical protein
VTCLCGWAGLLTLGSGRRTRCSLPADVTRVSGVGPVARLEGRNVVTSLGFDISDNNRSGNK